MSTYGSRECFYKRPFSNRFTMWIWFNALEIRTVQHRFGSVRKLCISFKNGRIFSWSYQHFVNFIEIYFLLFCTPCVPLTFHWSELIILKIYKLLTMKKNSVPFGGYNSLTKYLHGMKYAYMKCTYTKCISCYTLTKCMFMCTFHMYALRPFMRLQFP